MTTLRILPASSPVPCPLVALPAFQAWAGRFCDGQPISDPSNSSGRIDALLAQSHFDDVALSIGASLGSAFRFSHSLLITTHSASPQAALRLAEDRLLQAVLGSARLELGLLEGSGLPVPSDQIRRPWKLVLGPAGIGRNRDHWATREFVRRVDDQLLTVLWEDLAYWGIYAMSSEDRVEFALRNADWLQHWNIVNVDVSSGVFLKRRLLQSYPSQSKEGWRPLRYGYLTALEAGLVGRFVERLFVPKGQFRRLCRQLEWTVTSASRMRYGTLDLTAYNVSPKPQ